MTFFIVWLGPRRRFLSGLREAGKIRILTEKSSKRNTRWVRRSLRARWPQGRPARWPLAGTTVAAVAASHWHTRAWSRRRAGVVGALGLGSVPIEADEDSDEEDEEEGEEEDEEDSSDDEEEDRRAKASRRAKREALKAKSNVIPPHVLEAAQQMAVRGVALRRLFQEVRAPTRRRPRVHLATVCGPRHRACAHA